MEHHGHSVPVLVTRKQTDHLSRLDDQLNITICSFHLGREVSRTSSRLGDQVVEDVLPTQLSADRCEL